MAADLASQENKAWIENEREIDDDVGDDVGTLVNDLLSPSIPCVCKVKDVNGLNLFTAALRDATGFLVFPVPAFQYSGAGQNRFQLAKFVNRRLPSQNVRQAKVGDFSR